MGELLCNQEIGFFFLKQSLAGFLCCSSQLGVAILLVMKQSEMLIHFVPDNIIINSNKCIRKVISI